MSAVNFVRRIVVIGIAAAAGSLTAGLVGAGLSHADAAPVASLSVTKIQSVADGSALRPAVRLNPPTPVAPPAPVIAPVAVPETATTVTNTSNCRTTGAGIVAVVTIPSISYDCPVFAGGQSTLDSGAVTWIDEVPSTPVLATTLGGKGTVWLAGHRSGHGAAFAAIPDLADGALITVTDATGSFTYRVVGRSYVGVRKGVVVGANGVATNDATLTALLRPDHGGSLQPRLVLQTCDGASFRWMIYADLVG